MLSFQTQMQQEQSQIQSQMSTELTSLDSKYSGLQQSTSQINTKLVKILILKFMFHKNVSTILLFFRVT